MGLREVTRILMVIGGALAALAGGFFLTVAAAVATWDLSVQIVALGVWGLASIAFGCFMAWVGITRG